MLRNWDKHGLIDVGRTVSRDTKSFTCLPHFALSRGQLNQLYYCGSHLMFYNIPFQFFFSVLCIN